MSNEEHDGGGWLVDEADATAAAVADAPVEAPAPAVTHAPDDEACACEMCQRLNALCDDLADVTLNDKHKNLPTAVKLEALVRLMSAINTEKSIPGQESHNGLSLVGNLTQRLVVNAERKQQQMVQRIMKRIAESGGTLPIEISAESLMQGGVFAGGHGDDDGGDHES